MDIRQLLDYTDRCRHHLHEALAAHPAALDAPIQTIGEYHTIHQLVAHCIGAEKRLIEQRLHGWPDTDRYEDNAAETVTGLFTDWEHIRAKTRAVIDASHSAASAPQLHHEIAFSLPQWGYAATLTVEEILFHIFNHQIFHLGQISLVMQMNGIDPPYFDYVFLHRDPDTA